MAIIAVFYETKHSLRSLGNVMARTNAIGFGLISYNDLFGLTEQFSAVPFWLECFIYNWVLFEIS